MRQQGGFTLLENMLSIAFLMVAVMAFAPAIRQDLIVTDVLWERRQALKVVERELEEACNTAQTSAGFDGLASGNLTAADFTDFGEFDDTNPQGTVTVDCVDTDLQNVACPSTLKQVVVRVEWTSKGNDMWEQSANYLIAQTGVCGTGQ